MNRAKQSTQQSTLAAERQRGRPLDNNHPDLKILLLDVAEQLFTDHGYAGTSIRRIANTAGVNPALVHYYFGNKQTLLETVLERALKPMMIALAALKNKPQTSTEDITVLFVNMAIRQPNIPRLMAREVLLPGGEMQKYFLDNLAPHLGGALPALLQQEKTAGHLRDDVDPAYAALMLLSLCIFPFIARSMAEPALGINLGEDGAAKLIKNISNLLNQGIAK